MTTGLKQTDKFQFSPNIIQKISEACGTHEES